MAEIRCLQVDAFAAEPFSGNPAAVCLLDGERDDDWMQAVAAEMNLSETAFVWPYGNDFGLRWFTPAVEVELCGHATLASAHALWSEGIVADGRPIRFHTLSGVLTCVQKAELIELDFPATPVRSADAIPELAEALGTTPVSVATSTFDLLVLVESAETVRSLAPDFARLRQLPARGIIVTSASDDPAYDFVSRFFGPAVGIDEDPVTGSAHCCLAPFWAERLEKTEMIGFQASRRGGVVRVRIDGDRVTLGGNAVTIFKGELTKVAVSRSTNTVS